MSKKTLRPLTKVKNPEPKNKFTNDWVIWAAWADRVTFEDIRKETGKNESEVIKIRQANFRYLGCEYLGFRCQRFRRNGNSWVTSTRQAGYRYL